MKHLISALTGDYWPCDTTFLYLFDIIKQGRILTVVQLYGTAVASEKSETTPAGRFESKRCCDCAQIERSPSLSCVCAQRLKYSSPIHEVGGLHLNNRIAMT